MTGPHQLGSLRRDPARRAAAHAGKAAFIVLLGAVVLLPRGSGTGNLGAIRHLWVWLPLCVLFVGPFVDPRRLRSPLCLDLLALLSFLVSLALFDVRREAATLLTYPPLIYLAVRMVVIARVGRRAPSRDAGGLRLLLPRSWMVAGIAALAAVHVGYGLNAQVIDVGRAGVLGAQEILKGQRVYGAAPLYAAHPDSDPHLDTYGPANYEAYVPFVAAAGPSTAARLVTLFFDLLTAVLLFALGRQARGPTAGVALAYAWLAFPLTLYADVFGVNDAIVSAAVVGTVLGAGSPARRGVMAALAGLTKLSPLALIPLMAAHNPSGETPRTHRRGVLVFAAAAALTSLLVFLPALRHTGVGTFLNRTFAFQGHRSSQASVWGLYEGTEIPRAPWVSTSARVALGLTTALTVAFALVVTRLPRRQDTIGLAACSAAILITLEMCGVYFSYTYVLWFAPLAMAAFILSRAEPGRGPRELVRTASDVHLPLRLSRREGIPAQPVRD